MLALAVLGVGAYELVPRDDRRITSVLNELCAKLNETRDPGTLGALRASLRTSLTPQVSVQAAELGSDLVGRDAVVERAGDLLAGPPLTFSLVDSEVHVSGALARVSANLIVTERGSGEQHRDLRLTEVRLRKVEQAWRIESVRVEPVRPAEPEARP